MNSLFLRLLSTDAIDLCPPCFSSLLSSDNLHLEHRSNPWDTQLLPPAGVRWAWLPQHTAGHVDGWLSLIVTKQGRSLCSQSPIHTRCVQSLISAHGLWILEWDWRIQERKDQGQAFIYVTMGKPSSMLGPDPPFPCVCCWVTPVPACDPSPTALWAQ